MDTPQLGPRDLGPYVAQLLRELHFTVWEQPTVSLTLVSGTYTALSGAQFHFQYAHHHPVAGPVAWAACSMGCRPAGATQPTTCFSATQVRRLREVRLLLLGNELFAHAAHLLSLV